MSDPAPATMQNSKVLIGTAAITAVTTILVSFIGIVPQLRKDDRNEVQRLQQQFDEFKKHAGDTPLAAQGPKVNIIGTVRSEDGTGPLPGHDIYLLPESDHLFTTKTDDQGKFTFLGVPPVVYSIIVRDSSNGKSGKALLDDAERAVAIDTDQEVQVIGAKVKYRIKK